MRNVLKEFLVVMTLFFLSAGFAYAVDKGNVDVVLVIDSSGSMKKTDPLSLRIPAAKLFISLLSEGDRAGVISFSDKGYPIRDLTPVDSAAGKDGLLKSADRITSDGLYTNLYDALGSGFKVLSEDRREDGSRIIVLMSDGMMDTGDADKDTKLLEQLRTTLADSLVSDEVKVYSIAFTAQSDQKLLQKVSKQTGGFYNLALTDKELHLIFTSIFESLKAPEMLPMTENGFLIDQSISEVTIVVTKESPGTKIQINSPDGIRLTSEVDRQDIKWFASNTFDMITVQKPAAGRWEILFSTGENNRAYIITDLKLQSNFDQMYSTYGDPLDIKIWLEKDGSVLSEQDILDKIDVFIELTGPDGKTSRLRPFSKGDGTFLRKIAPFIPGNYEFKIIAKGKTFERAKSFVFNIADVNESKEDVIAEREKTKEEEPPVEQRKTEEDHTNSVSWKKVITQFVSINIVIGLIVLLYIKRDKLKVAIASGRIKPLLMRKKESGGEGEIARDKISAGPAVTEPRTAEERPSEKAGPEEEVVREEEKNEIVLEDEEGGEDAHDDSVVQEDTVQEASSEKGEESAAETKPEEEESPEPQANADEQAVEAAVRADGVMTDTGETEQETGTDQDQHNSESDGRKSDTAPEEKGSGPAAEDAAPDMEKPEADMPRDTGEDETSAGKEDPSEENIEDMWQAALQEQHEAKTDEQAQDKPSPEGTAIRVEKDKTEDTKTDGPEAGKDNDQQIVDIDEINKLLEAEKDNRGSGKGTESD